MGERLRRLSYLSESSSSRKAVIPSELASIVIQSRRFNRAHKITGFLTYRNGRYFQTLEGPRSKVDSLFDKILSDPRHHDLELIWDEQNIDKQYFSGWKLKLAHSSVSCDEVNNFLNDYRQKYENLQFYLKDLLGQIFDFDSIFLDADKGPLPSLAEFSNHEFRLRALPLMGAGSSYSFAQVDIFSALLSGWHRPDQLAARFDLSKDELAELFSQRQVKMNLVSRELAAHSRWVPPDNVLIQRSSAPKVQRSFYQGLKSFFLASRR